MPQDAKALAALVVIESHLDPEKVCIYVYKCIYIYIYIYIYMYIHIYI